jgi:cell fate regulator YaaT (PSP1 superfamily)
MHLVEVAFRGNRKQFYLWDGEESLAPRIAVIVEADRGEDLGHVHATGEAAEHRCTRCSHGCGTDAPQQKVLRRASSDEERRARDLAPDNDSARRRAIEKVRAHGLVMKISDAEWQWDRRKLTLYFTAEKRVDFRALVRDLASMFRTRIELKQIGVRDEAKRLSGIGRCGREYCSAAWLPDLRPVSLQVAKDQRLSLNPSQISGACGRLMCCLRYEHDFYVQSRKRFPKEGKVIATARGEEKVLATDIFGERVTLRDAEGETRTVALAELKRELETRGGLPYAPSAGPAPAAPAVAAHGAHAGMAPEVRTSAGTERPATGHSAARVRRQRTERDESAPSEATEIAPEQLERRPSARPRRRGRRGGRRSRPSGERPGPLPPEE